MKYTVQIAEAALAEINEVREWLAARSTQAADEWLDEMLQVIDSLEQFPNRGPVASETIAFERELRFLVAGMYLVLYEVVGRKVVVVHVRHGARLPLNPDA